MLLPPGSTKKMLRCLLQTQLLTGGRGSRHVWEAWGTMEGRRGALTCGCIVGTKMVWHLPQARGWAPLMVLRRRRCMAPAAGGVYGRGKGPPCRQRALGCSKTSDHTPPSCSHCCRATSSPDVEATSLWVRRFSTDGCSRPGANRSGEGRLHSRLFLNPPPTDGGNGL